MKLFWNPYNIYNPPYLINFYDYTHIEEFYIWIFSVKTDSIGFVFKVSQGKDCSICLECKKSKITTLLKVSQLRSFDAKSSKLTPASEPEAEIKKKKNSSKRLQKLLAYHQRLVTDKGLLPSRLMLQLAAAIVNESVKKPEEEKSNQEFKCDQCDHTFKTMHGLKVHKEHIHKENLPPESLSEDSLDNSFVVSPTIQKPVQRKEHFSCENCVYSFKSKLAQCK